MNDRHEERFRKVLSHIDAHLDGDLSLTVLAAVASYSPYHFHRRFSGLTGMGVHRYVQLSRFKRAAWQVAFRSDVSITDMAFDAGYDSVDGFARAFRQRLGQAPSVFRQAPDWAAWAAAWRDLDNVRRFHMAPEHTVDDVRVMRFPGTPVACLSHVGPPETIGGTIRRFIAWRRANGLPPSRADTWNIVYDDPDETPPDRYRMDLCVTCAAVEANDAGVVASHIAAGRCAVLRHVGSDALLSNAVRYLYGEWLSSCGEEPRDAPLFLRRVAFFPDVPEHEAVTEIYLPLAERSSSSDGEGRDPDTCVDAVG